MIGPRKCHATPGYRRCVCLDQVSPGMDTTTTSSCAPAAPKDAASGPRRLQQWHATTTERTSRCWVGRVQRKRIGRDTGCKLLWNPAFSRFEIRGGNPTATQSSKVALLCLEAQFHHDQALWTAKKAQRRADRLAAWMSTECYETQTVRYKAHSSSLWHMHRRGKRKESNQHRQQDKVDSTRRSTAPRGRRSKLLQFGVERSMKRSSCTVKWSARGANSISRVYEQLLADRQALPFAVCADQQCQEWQQYLAWRHLRGQRKQAKKQAKESAARAKQTDPVRVVVLQVQSVAIKLDSATQQQWDLLAKTRRWGGLLQRLINLLRPRFAGATMFALKQAFALCNASDFTAGVGTIIPTGRGGALKINADLVRLLAPAKPKRQSPTAVSLVAGEADLRREQAARLRLGRAVELLLGDVSALTQAQMEYVQNQATRPEPGPEPGPETLKAEPEPLEKLRHAAEWPKLVATGAAAA